MCTYNISLDDSLINRIKLFIGNDEQDMPLLLLTQQKTADLFAILLYSL